jgi:mannose/cellobiose epimerase-like protein (N-acyl-D-glucosamine 2-epimerase family)
MTRLLSSLQWPGITEPATDKLPRRQNPHMHLLEAVLAMHAATGDVVWLDRANRLITLFTEVFFDEKTGSVAEFFDAAWQPAEGEPGLLREPGHQFEWVWLLHQYMVQAGGARTGPAAGVDLESYASRLFDFGSRHGIDAAGPLQGLVFDAVSAQGLALATSKLLWPQTEYIKACIARHEATKNPSFRALATSHMKLMRDHFFRSDGANWVNHVARDGAPLVTQTPARVLYHLFLAASELIRIEEA